MPSGHRLTISGEDRELASEGSVGICRVDLAGEEPDSRQVLRTLEAFDVFVLPRPETLSPDAVRVLDGISLQAEILEGRQYRTYRTVVRRSGRGRRR
jgi:hypothetical protein